MTFRPKPGACRTLALWASASPFAEARPRSAHPSPTHPDNPTGTFASPELLESVLGVARECGLQVVSDEIYAELVHAPAEFVSAATVDPDVVVTGGLSKSHALGGWRVGVLRAPANTSVAGSSKESRRSGAKSGPVSRRPSTPRQSSPMTNPRSWSSSSIRRAFCTRQSSEPHSRSLPPPASRVDHRRRDSTSTPTSRRCSSRWPSAVSRRASAWPSTCWTGSPSPCFQVPHSETTRASRSGWQPVSSTAKPRTSGGGVIAGPEAAELPACVPPLQTLGDALTALDGG